jgi:hypothetical protein
MRLETRTMLLDGGAVATSGDNSGASVATAAAAAAAAAAASGASAGAASPPDLGLGRRDSGGAPPPMPSIPEDGSDETSSGTLNSSILDEPAAVVGAAGVSGARPGVSASPELGALCAEEDQATLSQFMQISHTLAEAQAAADLTNPAGVDLDPALVNFLQRNARSVIARRRYERLRTTAVKLQSSVRARRGQQVQQQEAQQRGQQRRIEGAARLVQSRFRQSRRQQQSSGGPIRTKQQHAKAAHIIQAHVRAYLTAQQDELTQQQRQREVAAVSTIEDRVKM